MEDIKWCPQHGYPLPCAKCGMPSIESQREIFEKGRQAGIKERRSKMTVLAFVMKFRDVKDYLAKLGNITLAEWIRSIIERLYGKPN